MVRALIGIAYLVIGIVVASTHHYLGHLGTIKAIAAAVLAVLLWPLVLLGVNLHLGTTGRRGKRAAAFVLGLLRR